MIFQYTLHQIEGWFHSTQYFFVIMSLSLSFNISIKYFLKILRSGENSNDSGVFTNKQFLIVPRCF